MTVIRWIVRGLIGLVLLLIGVIAGLLVAMWVADPSVPRNLFFGQPISAPDRVELSQPQARVPGAPRDDLQTSVVIGEGPDTDIFDPVLFDQAVRYADESNSVALLVQQAGVIRYERYWPGFDPATRTNPNSMHKPVLALLLGAAIADGFIPSLDSPAATWLHEWQDDERANITLRHLLQMSSGLEVPIFGTWKSARILFGSNLVGGVTTLLAEKPPGTEFQYSNANSQLLSVVLERATGEPYAHYLSRRLWQPLGAQDAALWLDRVDGMPRGFCCLFATARDWLRIGELILQHGMMNGTELIPRSFINEMLQPSPLNPNFGMQIWLGSPVGEIRKYNDYTVTAFHSEKYGVDDVIYIDGYGGQRVYIVPSRELVIVRTGVSRSDWDDAIIPNAILRAQRVASKNLSDSIATSEDQP